jgi:transposase
MQHFAIDLGSRESQVCIRNETGQIMLERRVLTRALPNLLRKQPRSRVVMETCAEAFAVADAAIEIGHEVRVVPATLVRALGIGARGIKTDVRDANVLSNASVRMDLPSVHVPTMSSREGKAMCNARDVLIKARTMLINAERGYLRSQTVKVPSGGSETFPARV